MEKMIFEFKQTVIEDTGVTTISSKTIESGIMPGPTWWTLQEQFYEFLLSCGYIIDKEKFFNDR